MQILSGVGSFGGALDALHYHLVWLISKNQIYARWWKKMEDDDDDDDDDDGRWWCKKMMMEECESASLVIWWSPWKKVIDSSHAPSILSTPPDHQLEDLTLKSPAINSEWGLKLLRCTISCSKVLMKHHTRRLIGWVIDKDLLCKISDR